jgi:hypothetical protein
MDELVSAKNLDHHIDVFVGGSQKNIFISQCKIINVRLVADFPWRFAPRSWVTMSLKKLKRLKNDALPTPEIPNTDTCLLNEMPYEIMEMIFGNVNFIDLPNLLLVSRGITV